MKPAGYRPPSAQASLHPGDGQGNNARRRPSFEGHLPGSRGSDGGGPPPMPGPPAPERGNALTAHATASTAVHTQKEAEKRVAGTAAGSDAEAPEDLAFLLEQLTQQKAELRLSQQKVEARRVGLSRWEDNQKRGRQATSDIWKRPSGYGHEFSPGGLLPVKYLNPFEQQASTRPSRSYERAPDPVKGPFRDVCTYPQLFGEPHPLPHQKRPLLLNSARAVLVEASPRCTNVNEEVKKPWLPTIGTPRELGSLKFVAERLDRFHGTRPEHLDRGHDGSAVC